MAENEIVVRHLDKFYGKKQALFDLSLTVGPGMYGLLGRNGAGKTTLMRTLATLLRKKSGEVRICGIPLENAREVRRIIGYLPQEFSMYPGMTVTEVMDYLAVLSGLPASVRRARIPELLEKVNLSEHRGKHIRALSGGMKRRLGIAQALLNDPKVLIVDEPTAGLDPEERIRFRNLLGEAAENKIVLLSTHIVGDIEAACGSLAVLHEGRLLYSGAADGLLKAAEGHVYAADVQRKELPWIKEMYTVTGMLGLGSSCTVRFLADTPPSLPAQACEPSLEDAYMLCLRRGGAGLPEMGGDA